MLKINKLKIYTDGGSRGNPGPAAIGVHAAKGQTLPLAHRGEGGSDLNGEMVFQLSQTIGNTTNNVAEWQAVIKALDYLIKNNIQSDQIDFFLDSELVVKQIKREYKIKQPHLQTLSTHLHQLLQQLDSSQVYFHYLPREQNKTADFLVNQALDSFSK